MQLEKLTLTDVGTFRGRHEFDLTPRLRQQKARPIVLFGGLNGAGKTTFLTSVRLALYGRQSIEFGSTQAQYEEFLYDLIHRSRDSATPLTSASILLEFTYARLGERVRYGVARSWETRSQGVKESLQIFRNDQLMESLTAEQAQAFLNQLIPSGISQFFFFDGEKIASLARDDSDSVLADAIRRLFGLDLADRLSTDLMAYSRQKHSKSVTETTKAQIAELETSLGSMEAETKTRMDDLVQILVPALDSAKAEYERISAELMDRGGAWAVNRNAMESQIKELQAIRADLEDRTREQLTGLSIFALAPKLSAQVIESLKQSHVVAEQKALVAALTKSIGELKKELAKVSDLKKARSEVNECIDSWAEKISQQNQVHTDNFGLSDADAKTAIASLSVSVPIAQRELVLTHREVLKCAMSEEELQDKLAHAPSDESLNSVFEKLKEASEKITAASVKRAQCLEDIRRKVWAQIEIVRKLKKLRASHSGSSSNEQSENIVDALHGAIAEFSQDAAVRKCEVLRKYFVAAFKRLARKGDIVHDAQICPEKFKVTLLDRNGIEVPKKRLSAGEKQIYAIAMLEALGKASGRNLPVIIDTPLGRLDTSHRQKLVDSYFASASHQVIILSTDTEVDLSFYDGLKKNISHGYHLIFDETIGASIVEEGYFWKSDAEVLAHAA